MATETELSWYMTSYEDIFPGCKTCCELTLSPMAHEAMDSFPLSDLDTEIMPIYRGLVSEFHANDHTFLTPTPAMIPKRRRKAITNTE